MPPRQIDLGILRYGQEKNSIALGQQKEVKEEGMRAWHAFPEVRKT